MKHIFIFLLSLLLVFSASAQAVYRWKLSIGSGTLFYIGDVGDKKMSRPSTALHVSLERRFAYGIAARARGEFGHISANDRTNAFNKIRQSNPNFDRNLNFRTRMANAYIELLYYTNNGYIFKEDALVTPYVLQGQAFLTSKCLWTNFMDRQIHNDMNMATIMGTFAIFLQAIKKRKMAILKQILPKSRLKANVKKIRFWQCQLVQV